MTTMNNFEKESAAALGLKGFRDVNGYLTRGSMAHEGRREEGSGSPYYRTCDFGTGLDYTLPCFEYNSISI